MNYKTLIRVSALSFATLLSGCGANERIKLVTVSGEVTLNGTPLQDGVVEMMDLKTGYAAGAPLDESGHFNIERIPIGTYVVAVRPPYLPPPGEPIPLRPATMGPIRKIPAKYSNSAKSGFTLSVSNEGASNVRYELN